MPNRFQRPDPTSLPARLSPPPPPGLAAILDSIDGEERGLAVSAGGEPTTGAEAFADVFNNLAANLTEESPVLPPNVRHRRDIPLPLTSPGDLVVVFGGPRDALAVARSMAAVAGTAAVVVGGSIDLPGAGRVDDRRTAVRARALGVLEEHPVFLAYGIGLRSITAPGWTDVIAGISPDQVWVAVDAGRKPHDTAAWVQAIATRIPVDAVAVEGTDSTSSPETVDELGLPIGWMDGTAPDQGRFPRTVWDS